MVRECVVIIVILVVAGFGFLRSRRTQWFGAIFPLMVVPLLNIIFSPHFWTHFQNGYIFRLAMYFVGFAASSIWVLLWSRKLPRGRLKYAYIFCATGFTFLLIVMLIVKGTSIH